MTALSVVVPVASESEPLTELVENVRRCLPDCEIVLAGPERCSDLAKTLNCRFVRAECGRADALNRGAAAAHGLWLWFLHADSSLPLDASGVLSRVQRVPDRLWYCDLRFSNGPCAMRINAVGVAFRSAWLGCPFGDQGFLIQRSLCLALGGFPAAEQYGEDHCFVWRARRAGLALRRTGFTLTTSARRYVNNGWRVTTGLHLRLWSRQAWREWLRQ